MDASLAIRPLFKVCNLKTEKMITSPVKKTDINGKGKAES